MYIMCVYIYIYNRNACVVSSGRNIASAIIPSRALITAIKSTGYKYDVDNEIRLLSRNAGPARYTLLYARTSRCDARRAERPRADVYPQIYVCTRTRTPRLNRGDLAQKVGKSRDVHYSRKHPRFFYRRAIKRTPILISLSRFPIDAHARSRLQHPQLDGTRYQPPRHAFLRN